MLSPAQFAEIIALIETTQSAEKISVRRAERRPHPCRVTISLGTQTEAGPTVDVEVKDISARGMCFIHNCELAPGTAFVVRLEPPVGHTVTLLSTIVHTRDLGNGLFQFGAEYTCVLGQQSECRVEPGALDVMRIRSSILD